MPAKAVRCNARTAFVVGGAMPSPEAGVVRVTTRLRLNGRREGVTIKEGSAASRQPEGPSPGGRLRPMEMVPLGRVVVTAGSTRRRG